MMRALTMMVVALGTMGLLTACDTTSPDGTNTTPVDPGPSIGQPYQSECLANVTVALMVPDASPVTVTVDGSKLTVVDSEAMYNCCLKAWMEVKIDGSEIEVVEVEDPDKTKACFCTCPFQLSIEVDNLAAGTYTVRVHRQGAEGNELIHTETVQI